MAATLGAIDVPLHVTDAAGRPVQVGHVSIPLHGGDPDPADGSAVVLVGSADDIVWDVPVGTCQACASAGVDLAVTATAFDKTHTVGMLRACAVCRPDLFVVA